MLSQSFESGHFLRDEQRVVKRSFSTLELGSPYRVAVP